jgi:hypothetical protein
MHHAQVPPEALRIEALDELEGDALGAAVTGSDVKTERQNADSRIVTVRASHAAGMIGAGEPAQRGNRRLAAAAAPTPKLGGWGA